MSDQDNGGLPPQPPTRQPPRNKALYEIMEAFKLASGAWPNIILDHVRDKERLTFVSRGNPVDWDAFVKEHVASPEYFRYYPSPEAYNAENDDSRLKRNG